MAELNGARVVITGAAGFVGAHLWSAFAREGANVVGLVRPSTDRWRIKEVPAAQIVACDLGDERDAAGTFARLAPDVVVHSAIARPPKGEGWHDRFARQNAALGWNVVSAAHGARAKRVVWLTTQYEYPGCASPAAEDDTRPPDTFFGAVKLASSLVARRFAHDVGLELTCLRLFSVYGPLEGPDRFVQVALRAALTGEVLPLTASDPVHDFVYIDDVVRSTVIAATHVAAPGQVFNVATGTGTTNRAVVACIERLAGRKIQSRPGAFEASARDRDDWRADVHKATERLGFRAEVGLEDGLARNLAWWRSRLAS